MKNDDLEAGWSSNDGRDEREGEEEEEGRKRKRRNGDMRKSVARLAFVDKGERAEKSDDEKQPADQVRQ